MDVCRGQRSAAGLALGAAEEDVVYGGDVGFRVAARDEAVVAPPDVNAGPRDRIHQGGVGQQTVDRNWGIAARGAEVGPTAQLDGSDQSRRNPLRRLARSRVRIFGNRQIWFAPVRRRKTRDTGPGQSVGLGREIGIVFAHDRLLRLSVDSWAAGSTAASWPAIASASAATGAPELSSTASTRRSTSLSLGAT